MTRHQFRSAALTALLLSGCPGQVPDQASFGLTDTPAAQDTAQPADAPTALDANDGQSADDAATDAVTAELPAADVSFADAGCAKNGCPPASACHTVACQSDGSCAETKVADGQGCGTGSSCHSGICLADPPKAIRVVAAGVTTCALLEGGTVRCWGDDTFGQLGDGQSGAGAMASTPVQVAGLQGATDLACGGGHCCAIAAGKVSCWGANQLSACNPSNSSDLQLVATEVAGLSSLGTPSGIAAGDNHSCAILGKGMVYCWGLGTAGQLGDGLGAMGGPITQATLADYALEIRAGTYFSCARTAYATAYCWGDNFSGQIGNGQGGTSQFANSPAKVGDFSDIEALATGDQHACALRKGGQVWCWGRNNSGELGNNGGNTTYSSPVQAQGQSGVTSIAAGGTHTCAVGAMGDLWCWGSNMNGQIGLGTSVSNTKIPKQVAGLDNVVEVAAGDAHTCVRKKDGSVWCWGGNSLGQCGVGAGKDVVAPVKAY